MSKSKSTLTFSILLAIIVTVSAFIIVSGGKKDFCNTDIKPENLLKSPMITSEGVFGNCNKLYNYNPELKELLKDYGFPSDYNELYVNKPDISMLKTTINMCDNKKLCIIHLADGNYIDTSTTDFTINTKKNIVFYCDNPGQCIINTRKDLRSNYNTPFLVKGTVGAAQKLTADIKIGDTSMQVTNAASFKIGETTKIMEQTWGTNGNGGKIKQVIVADIKDIQGNTIYFTDPMKFEFKVAYSAEAVPVTTAENIMFYGIHFKGWNSNSTQYCVFTQDSKNLYFINNKFSDCGYGGLILGGYNLYAEHNEAYNIYNPVIGYAIAFGVGKNMYVKYNYIHDTDEANDCGYGGFPHDMYFTNNIVSNTKNGVDHHPNCFYSNVISNDFFNIPYGENLGSGWAMSISATHAIFDNNIIVNVGKGITADESIYKVLQPDGRYIEYNYDHTFNDNLIYDDGALAVPPRLIRMHPGLKYNNNWITNNKLYCGSSDTMGIHIMANSNNVIIEGNEIYCNRDIYKDIKSWDNTVVLN